jgi:NADPH-dependent glutamate synthase beta subunit-like oxidoreductase/Pyruvate/2-oxoacid:ferredoxin oxidoreductase delta subunit
LKANPDHPPEFVIPISYGSTEVIETGKWGFQKPQTSFMAAPCQESCPAGNPIPQFIYLANEGRYNEALQALLKENPFPGICGRVCIHPCEPDCNRGQYDESVSIRSLERHVFDRASNQLPDVEPFSDQHSRDVAIVGSGPAGLSCAYFLRLLGHRPTVFETKKEPGGVMRWGIPEYRLPKRVLRREVKRLLDLGVKIRTGVQVGKDISWAELDRFDSIFLSPGAGLNASLGIRGEELKKVWKGSDFLECVNSGETLRLERQVIVIGGGNTAMDVARSALRLDSRVTVAYRRTNAEMPAIKEGINEAEEEGVRFEFLVQPVSIRSVRSGKLAVRFQRMKLGPLDQSQRPAAIPIRGSFITLEADSVIAAVGEGVDLSWIPKELIKDHLIDRNLAPKIFAGGDAVAQPRTVITAIASGKKAAISMDSRFRGYPVDEVLSRVRVGRKDALSMETYLSGREEGKWPEAKEIVTYEQINTLFFSPAKRVEARRQNHERVLKGFLEVNSGFSSSKAKQSALRCFTCGTCNYCYNCYFFCPEGVISLDPSQQMKTVDLEHCKGCGTCAKACPRNAVEMKEVG